MIVSAQCGWGNKASDAGPAHGWVECSIDTSLLPEVWTGVVEVPVTFEGYDNPGYMKELDVRGRPAAQNNPPGESAGSDFNIPTPQDKLDGRFYLTVDGQNGEVETTLEVDTRLFPYDGWQQLRIAPIVKFDDSPAEMRSILRLAINIQNGHPHKDWFDGRTGEIVRGFEGVGFYVPTGYARAALRNPEAITEPVTGSVVLDVDFSADSCARCSKAGHPNKAAIRRSVILVDDEEVWSVAGAFQGEVEPFVVTPTFGGLASLAPGEHTLQLKTVQPDTILKNTNMGYLKVPFTVPEPVPA